MMGGISCNYEILAQGGDSVGSAENMLSEGWHFEDVAEAQHAAYQPLLEELRRGRPRLDFRVAAEAVRATGLAVPSLLEVGCGSGYYTEVFDRLVEGGVVYRGVDLSQAMIDLARLTYPNGHFEKADACALPFDNAQFDIVMNGVSLMHIVPWRQAVAEAARVTRRFVLLHTLPLLRKRPTTWLRKMAYGRCVNEVIINEEELLGAFDDFGLRMIMSWESISYDLSAVLGEAAITKTLLAEVS